jgi:hypothetical protein
MKLSLLLVIIILSACNSSTEKRNSEDLYKKYMQIEDFPEWVRDLKGEESNSLFLASAIFSYSCDTNYINYLLSLSEFPEKSNLNERFKEWSEYGGNYLETIEFLLKKDFSIYSKHFDDYKRKFNKNDCLLISGLIFPFYHTMLIDTTTFNVLHTVEEIRD